MAHKKGSAPPATGATPIQAPRREDLRRPEAVKAGMITSASAARSSARPGTGRPRRHDLRHARGHNGRVRPDGERRFIEIRD